MTSAHLTQRQGNRNATRHGLTAGQLPKGAAYVKRITDSLRVALETTVADRNAGEVSLYHAALIQSAVRWERHALLSQRWLRQDAATLNSDQRLSYSREVARASAERDKCLKLLGLDMSTHDHQQAEMIRTLYALPPAVAADERGASQPTSETTQRPDATECVSGDSGGTDFQETNDPVDSNFPEMSNQETEV